MLVLCFLPLLINRSLSLLFDRMQQSIGAGGGEASLSLSSHWDILGPFQIGTREASWGADPLELQGGFPLLHHDRDQTFPSSLAENGTVTWSTRESANTQHSSTHISASLSVSFSTVNWPLLQSVYGWAALQYQAWARGQLVVLGHTPCTVHLQMDPVLDIYVDGAAYWGGDFYSFKKAPLILHLEPGHHTIDVRLIRDVRAFGGIGEPTMDINIEARIATSNVEILEDQSVISHIVSGALASPHVSIALRNNGREAVSVAKVRASTVRLATRPRDADVSFVQKTASAILRREQSVVVVPGQTRPLGLLVDMDDPEATALQISVYIRTATSVTFEQVERIVSVTLPLTHRLVHEPHKVTHLHPSGIVSYHILRAPSERAECAGRSAPVMLLLHGAGVDADSEEVTRSMNPLPDLCAFVVYASGVTPWSGDDWHTWGFADVEAAIDSIPNWIEHNRWTGLGVNKDKWLVAGHSNGGQGTWYALTHRPDKVFAAAPISGYLSIQSYVPYQLWQPISPTRRSVLDGALTSYRHELLASNAKCIPILQQHGSADDNVPAYHSRAMHQLLAESSADSNYYEIPGSGHYFSGVMTTDPLRSFYDSQLKKEPNHDHGTNVWELVVANPANMGSKGGVQVLQLVAPGDYGKIHVRTDSDRASFKLRTTNVLAFELVLKPGQVHTLQVDGQDIDLSQASEEVSVRLVRANDNRWSISEPHGTQFLRSGKQLGAMDAILASNGPFLIRDFADSQLGIAVQLARNMFQYFSADSQVSHPSALGSDQDDHEGNHISIYQGHSSRPSSLAALPLIIKDNRVRIRDSFGDWHEYDGLTGLSAIYLAPLDGGRLELVVWGSNALQLEKAVRLVPMLTGVGQPDFIVLDHSSGWRGVEGALAMGFFDHMWNVSSRSIVT